MRASKVSLPTRSARITKLPEPLRVPPVTRSPGRFSTGRGSPVSRDSSTELSPSRMTPSTGTRSPGRTRRRLPWATRSRGTSRSERSEGSELPAALFSTSKCAVAGERRSRLRSALEVRLRARNSSTWPSSTSVTITAAASKYTGTSPPAPRKAAGKMLGATVASTL